MTSINPLWSRVSFAGHIRIVETPRGPGDQAAHTAAVIQALKDVRADEADIVQKFNEHAAEALRSWTPPVLHEGGKTSTYGGPLRKWQPALPVKMWKPPKPLSDAEALKRARKLDGKKEDIISRTTVRDFSDTHSQITFEEITE
jgi:hypothetical protein